MALQAVVKPYAHKPLGNKNISILDDDYRPSNSFMVRVIVLEPAQDIHTDLHCSIETLDLSSPRYINDYYAISYTWGPAVFTKTLFTHEGTLFITPTLDRALRRFRKR